MFNGGYIWIHPYIWILNGWNDKWYGYIYVTTILHYIRTTIVTYPLSDSNNSSSNTTRLKAYTIHLNLFNITISPVWFAWTTNNNVYQKYISSTKDWSILIRYKQEVVRKQSSPQKFLHRKFLTKHSKGEKKFMMKFHLIANSYLTL